MFSKSDCSEMDLNPFAIPHNAFIFNVYRDLSRRKVFSEIPGTKQYSAWGNKELDLLLKVIILIVDPQSPLSDETDFDFRKEQAVLLIGADSNENVLDEIDSEGPLFSSLVFNFFKVINNMEYESWYSLLQLYHDLCLQARRPLPKDADAGTINSKAKLSGAISIVETEVKKKQYNLFKDKRLEQKIMQESGNDELGGYAEKYAEEPEWKKFINDNDEDEEDS